MSRRKIRGIIAAVCAFYVVVAVLAIFMLKDNESVLAHKTMADLLFGKEETASSPVDPGKSSDPEPEKDPNISNDPNSILERWTEQRTEGWSEEQEPFTEAVTVPVTEAPTETVTEAPTEVVTEEPTEEATEPPTEEATEPPTEEVTEEPTEEATEELPEFGPQADGKYYVFETINRNQVLLMRESATKNSKAVGQLKSHSTGVVIERGTTWTKLYAKGTVGYCITEALEFKEVSKEEFEEMVRRSGE